MSLKWHSADILNIEGHHLGQKIKRNISIAYKGHCIDIQNRDIFSSEKSLFYPAIVHRLHEASKSVIVYSEV